MARLDLPSGVVHYYFSDHLGSHSVVTSANGGTIEQEADYYPFGGERAITAGPNNYKFTGKERDSESGLDYFGNDPATRTEPLTPGPNESQPNACSKDSTCEHEKPPPK